jgi:hypothetical protein
VSGEIPQGLDEFLNKETSHSQYFFPRTHILPQASLWEKCCEKYTRHINIFPKIVIFNNKRKQN